MLIEFSVANFRSFRDLQTLSMQASPLVSKNKELDQNNVAHLNPKLNLLKTKAIFGANASGKSNLFQAMQMFQVCVDSSVKIGVILSHKPFAFSTAAENEPTFLQAIFTKKNEENKEIIYRYGFEVKNGEIVSEWLFGIPKKIEVPFFVREGAEVKVNERVFKEGKRFEKLAKDEKNPIFREDSLFLSAVAVMGGSLAKSFTELLSVDFFTINSLEIENDKEFFISVIKNKDLHFKTISKLLLDADLNLTNLSVREVNGEECVFLTYDQYNKSGKLLKKKGVVYFDDFASAGSKKFAYLAVWLLVALVKGSQLIIDEFDARLHPQLTRKIVELFQNPLTNPNNAQLIFITHDTNFLDPELLRRDQICFVEKDASGSSVLKNLASIKGVRNDVSYEKEYLQGRYGAVPFLNQFENVFYETFEKNRSK